MKILYQILSKITHNVSILRNLDKNTEVSSQDVSSPIQRVNRLKEKNETLRQQGNSLKQRITALKKRNDDSKRQASSLRQRISSLKEKNENLNLKIAKLQPRLADHLIAQQTELAEFCLENLSPDSNSLLLARGVEALPSVIAVGQKYEIPTICDVLEVLEYEQRAAHRNSPKSTRLIAENSQKSMLNQCDHVLTVSNSISNQLQRIGVKAYVMEQWHVANAYEEDADLTKILEANNHVVVINCLQNEICSLESALEGFAKAKLEKAICIIAGRINPPHFQKYIEELVTEPRFSGKVKICGLLDADKYGTILSSADVGLVTLDPKIGNHNASFPNRVVDFAAFGVPICTPALPDIVNDSKLNGFLNLVNDVGNPNDWCKAIKKIIDSPKKQLKPVLANKNWSETFIEILGNSKEVIIVDNSWSWHGNRIKRQIMAILETNRKVTYISRKYINDNDGRRLRHPNEPFSIERYESLDAMKLKPAWSS